MYNTAFEQFKNLPKPIDIIVVGLGFMGFGFVSNLCNIPNVRIPLLISRRPQASATYLQDRGIQATVENDLNTIKTNTDKGIISVTDQTDLIIDHPAPALFEVTGTVEYGTTVALKALSSNKHLITMNPELQVTVGTALKTIADKHGLIVTDVVGDQPGSLTRLISQAQFMGFEVLLAGNMKRYLDQYATQEKMKPWADEKGLAVQQTTSFTDGTKQAIEMTLVGNYYGMDIVQNGMKGPQVETVSEVLNHFDWKKIPKNGIVDYVIGKSLFPGIFVVARHRDKNQQKYLKYLGLGDGPYYVLFEPYHLCHLEAIQTVAAVFFSKRETINNSSAPRLTTVAIAKRDLNPGDVLDGIGGDTVFGTIQSITTSKNLLPVGITVHCKVTHAVKKGQRVGVNDVILPQSIPVKLLNYK